MTEPVPGQTPEPAVADDATETTTPAGRPDTAEAPEAAETPETEAAEAEAEGAGAAGAAGPQPAAANPQELFGSLSLSAIEADIDRLMSDKMSQLDGMLAGLEDLVQRLEGEITNLEPPPDDSDTPKG
ncbi:hypothetical protein ADK67_43795 [Saccharothrix sp. NRRL B-16348]|uniref:hypothetical protein n=1 Tax=Saccharothrix sp. NRRL B-16348 TaxID=1415542 RepID=UPI0006AD9F14|nr:hypothetical protein [Saccharothrix sp. NRRL B-16348]KOX13725.1 hypothetical protein ADK67_43795 [Saccharothrix sp. NRRL B-16348]